MDNSFVLLSTMSPKINKKHKNIIRPKVPSKLALKKNIRRSSTFNNLPLPSTVENNSLILIDGSSTTDTSSNSSHSKLNIINPVPINISDTDSSNESERLTDVDVVVHKIPNDCGLSQSKFNAIDEWISNVKYENISSFHDSRNSEGRGSVNSLCKEFVSLVDHKHEVNLITNNKSETNCDSNLVASIVNSSSDVIEDSDDNSLLNELYGKNWRKPNNPMLILSEPRLKKKTTLKVVPKTEVKTKRKWSIVHKNPYLLSDQTPQNTPTQNKNSLELPWTKRLQALCDSDSSHESFKEVKQQDLDPVRSQLFNCDKPISKEIHKLNKTPNTPFSVLLDKNAQSLGNVDTATRYNRKKELKRNDPTKYNSPQNNSAALEDILQTKLKLDEVFSRKKKTLEEYFKSTLNINNFKDTNDAGLFTKPGTRIKKKTTTAKKLLLSEDIKENVDLPKKNSGSIRKVKTVNKKSSSESNSSGTKPNKESHTIVKHSEIYTDQPKSFLASLSGCVPLSESEPSARIFKQNYKLYKTELTVKLFKLYNEKIFNNAIPEDSLIEWSERMRGTAGYCYCKKITRRTGVIERKIRIVLASKVLDCADRLRDTLIHEMCHAATWIINEISNGHGDYWKAWAHKARQVFPELPPIKVCHNYTITTKYTYKCTSCGYSFGRHSKSLNIEKKRCGHCYGVFEILINKTTKGGEKKTVPITPKKEVSGFALFVKENYGVYKSPQLNHGQVMKLLGQKFGELKLSICEGNKEKA